MITYDVDVTHSYTTRLKIKAEDEEEALIFAGLVCTGQEDLESDQIVNCEKKEIEELIQFGKMKPGIYWENCKSEEELISTTCSFKMLNNFLQTGACMENNMEKIEK